MDIYQFAMQMEKDGENLYHDIRNRANQPGLKEIFTLLANQEAKHYMVIEQMSRGNGLPQLSEEPVFDNVKNIFIMMKETGDDFQFNASEAEIYQKALKLETESQQFYQDKANEIAEESKKQLLLRLAEEENKHRILMEMLIEFITRPQTWLENAEWNHLDEY